MMPIASVIVPVYNAELYLRGCVDSILSQTIDDFELILVDDGSLDRSGDICEEYKKKDKRIRVIHQNNSGAASARNKGIQEATGTYLAFCDSDDITSSAWLERLLAYAKEKILPIGAYCTNIDELGKEKKTRLEAGKEYNNNSYYDFNCEGIAGFLWNTLFSRDIVNRIDLRLREKKAFGDYNEDLIFTTTYVQAIDKIVYTGYSDYFYEMHADSLSRGNQRLYFEKYAEKYRIWYEFIIHNNSERNEMLGDLSTKTLYHFLCAAREAQSIYELKRIVVSPEMRNCLKLADTSRENQYEISLLRKQKVCLLRAFYKAIKIKEKIRE